jgi:hypothetical protein
MCYFARQLSDLGEPEKALEVLSRAVQRGFYCYAAMVRDPWLHGPRGKPECSEILRRAQELHVIARRTFVEKAGESYWIEGAESVRVNYWAVSWACR